MKRVLYSLGFMNYCSHDPAACLMRVLPNGKVDYIHFEEGMLSRKKQSYQFPLRAIQSCLNYYGVSIDDIDVVALDFMNDQSVHNTAGYYRKLIGDYLRATLKLRHDQVRFCDSHHLAHAYTAFYPSGFDEAAILTIDGLGSEQDTHSIYIADHNTGIKKIYSQKGTGIGLLYSLITEKLGFKEGEEGKTMGLAPYGREHSEVDDILVDLKGNYHGYCVDYSHLMQRQPSIKLLVDIEKCPNKEAVYSPYYVRLAYNIQKELESCLLHLAKEIRRRTGIKKICIAGGVGLNCVANEIIRCAGIFDEVYVQPASGDTGVSLGLAMYGIEVASRDSKFNPIDWKGNYQSFWTYSPIKIRSNKFKDILSEQNILHHPINMKVLAEKLTQKSIIAYYEGGWEFGPRALGHRSFLADPRHKDMKAILNKKIKHRESYRPFAPIIQKEFFDDYFDSPSSDHPHMLYAVNCKSKAIESIPTNVHVDKTARAQTCSPNAGNVYNLLDEFRKITGVPVLVNTSLNDNDEPIVMTPIDALSCFLRTGADILVVDDVVLFREEILDIEKLLKITESLQRESLNKQTDKALRGLIDCSQELESLDDFINHNLLSSLYEKNNKSYNDLERLFFVEKIEISSKLLITDEYHFNILKIMSVHYKRPIPFQDIQILKDNWLSLPNIVENAYILMYNISLLIVDSEVASIFPALSTCQTFYKSKDRAVIRNTENFNIDDLSDEIKKTYEVDKNKSIDDFFNNVINARFISEYL